jgi:hypothetical protein
MTFTFVDATFILISASLLISVIGVLFDSMNRGLHCLHWISMLIVLFSSKFDQNHHPILWY